ncbi:MAG TPA: hypothetical protein VMZ28_29010, partial [Kofleriaceae bacterium]|nr:hypothetical protein [Kofleriaceae bacterium]
PAPVQIDSGYQHTCVAWSNGRASCWGYDCNGQLGDLAEVEDCAFDDPTPPRSLVPVTVQRADGDGPLEGVVDVATTYASSCALLEDGTVWCWGGNDAGHLGDGGVTSEARPVPVVDSEDAPLQSIVSITAGGHHMCALDEEGTPWCWGANGYGQLGLVDWSGADDVRNRATQAQGGPYASIDAGGGQTCAIVGSGAPAEVHCWGRNNLGQLGYEVAGPDTSAAVQVLRDTTGNPPLLGAVRVGLGNNFTCAGAFPYSLWCWGQNKRHALGDEAEPAGPDGTTAWMARPNALVPVTDVVELGGGDDFACARLANGDVHCWGGNADGQIGTGSAAAYEPPSRVLRDAESLAVGFAQACVITTDRRVLCWGANDNGQLGDGTENARDTPTEVRELCQ